MLSAALAATKRLLTGNPATLRERTFTPRTFFYRNYPRRPFRCISESEGGTYTFKHLHPPHTDLVGTFGVKTCVGVYFALKDDSRCFIAHINAYQEWSSLSPPDYIPIQAHERSFFKDATIRRLQLEAWRHGWKPRNVRLETLVMVCAEPYHSLTGQAQTGIYVMEGIKEFLGAPKETGFEVGEGFVVGRDGHREVLSLGFGGFEAYRTRPAELAKYEPQFREGWLGWWNIALTRGVVVLMQ